jgi:MFS family permease
LTFAGVTAALSEEAFLSWGWRLPFLASSLLVVVGLYIRTSLEESPEFEHLQKSMQKYEQAPIAEVLSKHWGKLLVAVGARAGSDIAWYVFSLFLTIYLVRIGVAKSIALQAGMLAACTQIFAIPLFGYLADKWGSRTVLTLGALGGMVWAFIFFQLVDTKIPSQIILACIGGMFIQAALWAPLASFLPEMFPTHVRFTGAGLGFQLAGIAGGAFAPIICLSLLNEYGSSQPVAIYVAGALSLVLLAVMASARQSLSSTTEPMRLVAQKNRVI